VVDRLAGGGGGERVAALLIERIDPARFERTLCVTRPSSAPLLDEVRASGVRVLELDRRAQFDLAAWRPLLRLIRGNGVDVLHSHKFGSNVWAAMISRLMRVPVFVSHEHSWSFTDDRLRTFIDRRIIAPRANAMIAVSPEDARRMIEIEKIPPRKIRIIPNGIDPVRVGDPQRLRNELRVGGETPIIGIIASLRPEKRVDLLLDAATLLARSDRRFHIAIVGDGPLRKSLRDRAASSGVGHRVSFLGYRADARELAAGFDVAVLTSDREGTPLSLLEYMALQRAIVATSVGGVPDVVVHERHGLLVPPGNAGQLASAVARLLDSSEMRARLGAAAAARQLEGYDLEKITKQIECLYLELWNGSADDR
jgi:glycosyltransferase involved in cell wall biosynthesis